MDRLLGHLAQFASFWKQGELLCTHALAYLLRDSAGAREFSDFLASVTGSAPLGDLEWRPEITQVDGGRPDLEGRSPDGAAVVKIEAKLGAPFGKGQLESYINDLRRGGIPRLLLILVPGSRREEVTSHTCLHFELEGAGPWRLEPDPCVHMAVIAWEQLFDALADVPSASFADDLAQFRAMYRVFNGDDIEPLTTDEQVLAWREREDWWLKLVDLATQRLTEGKLLPLPRRKGSSTYRCRYVCRKIGNVNSCYSVGTRDPFVEHATPIWLRFHKVTGHFAQIRANLARVPLGAQAVRPDGHLWFPLEVPREADRETMIACLVEQVQRIVAVAYADVAPGAS